MYRALFECCIRCDIDLWRFRSGLAYIYDVGNPSVSSYKFWHPEWNRLVLMSVGLECLLRTICNNRFLK